jgi:hypothetical protein
MVKVTTKKIEPPRDNVVIEIDAATADILYKITGSIGGAPEGPRGEVDRLRLGLYTAGARDKYQYMTEGTVKVEAN